MEWNKGIIFGLALTLIGTPALAQQAQDPDEGTIQDTLQEPFSETMNQPIEETLGTDQKGEQETAVPSGEEEPADSDAGTLEDTLQSPAEETMNQPAEDTLEAAVPSGSMEIKGKITSIDEQTGNLTIETQDGKAMEMHADPAMLKGMELKKDTKVTAMFEKQGEMNHITQLKKDKKEEKMKKKERM